jgi:hypothetical protein
MDKIVSDPVPGNLVLLHSHEAYAHLGRKITSDDTLSEV